MQPFGDHKLVSASRIHNRICTAPSLRLKACSFTRGFDEHPTNNSITMPRHSRCLTVREPRLIIADVLLCSCDSRTVFTIYSSMNLLFVRRTPIAQTRLRKRIPENVLINAVQSQESNDDRQHLTVEPDIDQKVCRLYQHVSCC